MADIEMRQTQMLIQSDDCVTVPANETPVLLLHLGGSNIGRLIRAVNFLRCGVPSVQMITAKTDLAVNKHNIQKCEEEIEYFLDAIELFNESFDVSFQERKPESLVVATLTRAASRKP